VFLADILVRLRDAAQRRLRDVLQAARCCARISGVAILWTVAGCSGNGAGYFGRVRPVFCAWAPFFCRRTVSPVRRVFCGRPRLPWRSTWWQSSHQLWPSRLSPSGSRVRSPVCFMTRHHKRIACVKSLRSLRPPPLAHIQRVARSIKTRVPPVDSSGATLCRPLVSRASPAIPWGRNCGGQGRQPEGLLHTTEAFLPALAALFADPREAGRRLEPQPCRARRPHVHHHRDRGVHRRERRVAGVRNSAVTRRARVEGAWLALLQGLGATAGHFLPSPISTAQVDHGYAPSQRQDRVLGKRAWLSTALTSRNSAR
jgi:hypothetical protein